MFVILLQVHRVVFEEWVEGVGVASMEDGEVSVAVSISYYLLSNFVVNNRFATPSK